MAANTYRVVREELSEIVYKRIKNMILKSQLPTGTKLNQEKLAGRLGVSRTPLLTAFSKLEKEMLIELIPRRGAFVKKLTRQAVLTHTPFSSLQRRLRAAFLV